MENIYYEEINPIDKANEIMTLFQQLKPKFFSNVDEEYSWLEDGAKCIVISNPHSTDNIEICMEKHGEFILFFSEHHSHYSAYQGDYEDMLKDLKNIFNNNLCAGILFDNENNWYGDCWVKKDKISMDPKEIFDFVFKEKEFRTKLLKKGCRVKFVFWDPIDNTEIIK